MSEDFYTSDAALAQYLLFHYGTPEQICPILPEARTACGFPARCIKDPLAAVELTGTERALDLGCAVGRSTFELRRTFDQVLGIDFSPRFIEAAERMKTERRAAVDVPREGSASDKLELKMPPELVTDAVSFEVGDACALRSDLGAFDLVLMANLIDRLPDPARCLARLPALVKPDGYAIITSPYTWLEDYTPRDKWLDVGGTLNSLKECLAPAFALREVLDLPFLIREHRRKYQWSIAEATVWQRR